ncbi:MAG: zf-HC2 domain-containing protein [Anaerolineae bacterium]
MNCDRAGHLVDDYLSDNLSQRERVLFEEHLMDCSRCGRELRAWPAFERSLRRALATSVQPLSLSTEASARLVDAAEESLGKARRSQRTAHLARMLAAMAALALLLVGVLFLTGDIPIPSQLKPVALFPDKELPLADLSAPTRPPGNSPVLADNAALPGSLPHASVLFEPRQMHPHDPFTITVFLESDLSSSLESLRLDLDVSGPTGYYRFDMAVEGPLPGRGVTILRLTPDLLAQACEEQYLMAPTDVFSDAGTYNLRLTLFDAVVDSP